MKSCLKIAACSVLLSSSFSPNVEAKKHHHHKTTVEVKKHHSEPKPTLAGYIEHKYKRSHSNAVKVASAIHKASNRFGINKYVLTAIIAKESSFKPNASHYGSRGLMQVMVYQHLKEIVKDVKNITKTSSNIMVGSRILHDCLTSTAKGNMRHALSLYNRGSVNPIRIGRSGLVISTLIKFYEKLLS